MRLNAIVLLGLTIFSTIIFADQEINLSDEAVANDLLLGKPLTCITEGNTGKGTTVFSFKSVKGNKVKGEITEMSWSNCDWDVFKGTLKKNQLMYQAHTSSNCTTFIGIINFFHSEKGTVKAAGSWRTSDRYAKGTFECEL